MAWLRAVNMPRLEGVAGSHTAIEPAVSGRRSSVRPIVKE
jgi:hypothetical protein